MRRQVTWGSGGLISKRKISTSTSSWYEFGPQGETRKLTNSSGSSTDTYYYNAYGALLSSTGTTVNPYRYGGKYGYYTETFSGLILATQRWYSPQTMRWVSRDPIGYDGGVNLYEYVGGNPVKFLDPSGLDAYNYSNVPVWVKPENGKPFLLPPFTYYKGPIDGVKPPATPGYWFKVIGHKNDAANVVIDKQGRPKRFGGKGLGSVDMNFPDIPYLFDGAPGYKKEPGFSNRTDENWKCNEAK